MKFVTALAYHFCLNLPETFSQPRTRTFSQLCILHVIAPGLIIKYSMSDSDHIKISTKARGCTQGIAPYSFPSAQPCPEMKEKMHYILMEMVWWAMRLRYIILSIYTPGHISDVQYSCFLRCTKFLFSVLYKIPVFSDVQYS